MTLINPQWHYEAFDITNGNLDELLSLMGNEYGEVDPVHRDYFYWYCRDNPAGQAIVPVARDPATGQIIGGFWLVPLRACIRGRGYTGSATLNIVVRPAYRRKQVAVSLLNFTVQLMQEQQFDLLTSFPNPGMSKVVDQSLWQRVGQLDLMLRPLNWRFLQHSPLGKRPGLARLAASAGNLAWPRLARTPSTAAFARDFTLEEVCDFGNEFNDFWHRLEGIHPIMYIRDATFLRWRYCQNPRRSYQVVVARQAGEVVGYIAFRQAAIRHFPAGFIVDFIVEESKRGCQAGELLLEEAVAQLAADGADLVVAMMRPAFAEGALLKRQGFITFPRRFQPLPVVLYTIGMARDLPTRSLLNPDDWFLQLADFDIV